jgi:hypothetical protein
MENKTLPPADAGPVERMVRPAGETHPLVRRLDDMAAGWLCAGLPDAELPAEAAREIERLSAALEVSQAATNAAVSKAQWQARTNAELNEQAATIRRLTYDICRLLNAENDDA